VAPLRKSWRRAAVVAGTGVALAALLLPVSAGKALAGSVAVPSPSSVPFGNGYVGQPTGASTVTLSADGVDVTSVDVTGTGARAFTITRDGCGGRNVTQSCSVDVVFAPPARGPYTASLVFTDSASPSTQSVALSGTGVAPVAGLTPSAHDFGSAPVGSPGGSYVLTVSNNTTDSGQTLSVTSITTDSLDYTISGGRCLSPVSPSSACTFDVYFQPSVEGPTNTTVTVSTNDPVNPLKYAQLTGAGTASADVGVTATGPAGARSRDSATYVFTVSTAGPSSALNVTATVPVPSSSRFAGVSTTTGSCTSPSRSGTISCALGGLASGAHATIEVTLKLQRSKAGSVTVTAAAASASTGATSATFDPNSADNSAAVTTTVTR
jgi:hypothetical protein